MGLMVSEKKINYKSMEANDSRGVHTITNVFHLGNIPSNKP